MVNRPIGPTIFIGTAASLTSSSADFPRTFKFTVVGRSLRMESRSDPMRRTRLYSIIVNLVFLLLCGIGGPDRARAELHWRMEKRQSLQVRLIALAEADPRSSFFSTHEVFVAAQQLSQDESRLVKLVYEFLPYQPRLSESDFDYSVVHRCSSGTRSELRSNTNANHHRRENSRPGSPEILGRFAGDKYPQASQRPAMLFDKCRRLHRGNSSPCPSRGGILMVRKQRHIFCVSR